MFQSKRVAIAAFLVLVLAFAAGGALGVAFRRFVCFVCFFFAFAVISVRDHLHGSP